MDITDEVVQAFLEDYTGFSDSTIWTEKVIIRALIKADRETGGVCWGPYGNYNIKQEGMFAFAAHTLMIRNAENKAIGNGGVAPAVGAVTSRKVGDESVTYASPNTSGEAGNISTAQFIATTPGQEFIRLRNQVATGVTV